ncbi:hypothetical protein [Flavobacterium psychrotrophum]|uniref:hypothetical protein n=1 Tax=Flavobacterium psychrotrophum TaxID=2294119 RepID=UPI000E318CA9|nr:hypothetical protein [Flavobacterium psychrotrophum]
MASSIADGINAWKAAVNGKQNSRIVGLFDKGDAFRYVIPDYAQTCQQLHVYLGIVEDPDPTKERINFYVIPAEYDTPAHAADYQLYTKVCPLEKNLGSNRIPNKEAKQRIANWDKNYGTFIPAQNATTDGLFLAFVVDREDFETLDTYVNLALKSNGQAVVAFTAELIVTNLIDSKDVYDDFSFPVPPYGASATASSFYLLNL